MMPQRLLFDMAACFAVVHMLEKNLFVSNIKTYLNTSDSKASGQLGIYHFWMTHTHNFRENMLPQKLLLSIRPPASPSFICWEKKSYLYPINIFEHQRQQSRRTPRNLSFLGDPQPKFYTKYDASKISFFSYGHPLCCRSYVGRRKLFCIQ